MKTLTLLFCVIATSTVFWTSPAQDLPTDEAPAPANVSVDEDAKGVLDDWGLDRTHEHFIVKFRREYRSRRRKAQGNYTDIYNHLCKELERKDLDKIYRDTLLLTRYDVAIEMPGQRAVDALYWFAERAWDNPALLNNEAWKIADRGNSEVVPDDLTAAAAYLAERAVELDPNFAAAFDTLAHLYKMQERPSMAIHAAEHAVRYGEGVNAIRYKSYLNELQNAPQNR